MTNFRVLIPKDKIPGSQIGDSISIEYKERFVPGKSSFPDPPPVPYYYWIITGEEGDDFVLTPNPSLTIKP